METKIKLLHDNCVKRERIYKFMKTICLFEYTKFLYEQYVCKM